VNRRAIMTHLGIHSILPEFYQREGYRKEMLNVETIRKVRWAHFRDGKGYIRLTLIR